MGDIDDWITVAGEVDGAGVYGAGAAGCAEAAGATAQPSGSAAGSEDFGASAGADPAPADMPEPESPADDPLLRKAVTSPPVGTMATTTQPSADFSVSCAARAEGS